MMYKKEYADFRHALYVDESVNNAMWNCLDKIMEWK